MDRDDRLSPTTTNSSCQAKPFAYRPKCTLTLPSQSNSPPSNGSKISGSSQLPFGLDLTGSTTSSLIDTTQSPTPNSSLGLPPASSTVKLKARKFIDHTPPTHSRQRSMPVYMSPTESYLMTDSKATAAFSTSIDDCNVGCQMNKETQNNCSVVIDIHLHTPSSSTPANGDQPSDCDSLVNNRIAGSNRVLSRKASFNSSISDPISFIGVPTTFRHQADHGLFGGLMLPSLLLDDKMPGDQSFTRPSSSILSPRRSVASGADCINGFHSTQSGDVTSNGVKLNGHPPPPPASGSSCQTYVNAARRTYSLGEIIRLLHSPSPVIVSNAAAYLQHAIFKNPQLKEKTWQSGAIASLVQLLYSDDISVYANALGVLRNLTCGDNIGIKEEFERVGGLRALAWLIENRIDSTSRCCLNDHFGDGVGGTVDSPPSLNGSNWSNTRVKPTINLQAAPIQLALDNAAAVLCNLAASERFKPGVLFEALLPSLIANVIYAVARTLVWVRGNGREQQQQQRLVANGGVMRVSNGKTNGAANTASGDDNRMVWTSPTVDIGPRLDTLLFQNMLAVVRNVSSCQDAGVRGHLRQCPNLVWSLLRVIEAALATSHSCPPDSPLNVNSKCVENCVCAFRNLCFTLPHLSTSNDSRLSDNQRVVASAVLNKNDPFASLRRFRFRSLSMRTRGSSSDDGDQHNESSLSRRQSTNKANRHLRQDSLNGVESRGNEVACHSVQLLFYQPETLACIIKLARQTTNPCSLEAAAGSLQNLTVDSRNPISRQIRRMLHSLHALPLLTSLVGHRVKRVGATSVNALHSLALDSTNCSLLASLALDRLVAVLTESTAPFKVESSTSWWNGQQVIGSDCNGSNDLQGSDASLLELIDVLLKLLDRLLITNGIDCARRFITLGGAETCKQLLAFTSRQKTNPGWMDKNELTASLLDKLHASSSLVLRDLWQFSTLRPMYKLAGWKESDFGIDKRSKFLPTIKHRKSASSPVVNTEIGDRLRSSALTKVKVSQESRGQSPAGDTDSGLCWSDHHQATKTKVMYVPSSVELSSSSAAFSDLDHDVVSARKVSLY